MVTASRSSSGPAAAARVTTSLLQPPQKHKPQTEQAPTCLSTQSARPVSCAHASPCLLLRPHCFLPCTTRHPIGRPRTLRAHMEVSRKVLDVRAHTHITVLQRVWLRQSGLHLCIRSSWWWHCSPRSSPADILISVVPSLEGAWHTIDSTSPAPQGKANCKQYV